MTTNPVPQANEILYTLKLVNGEELLCTLVDVQETGIMIESPVSIKIIPILMEDGSFNNRMHYSAWMPFADTRSFYIDNADVIAMNPMHPSNHEYYVSLVNKLEVNASDLSESVSPSEHSFYVQSTDTLN
jgi:hypothetical protein